MTGRQPNTGPRKSIGAEAVALPSRPDGPSDRHRLGGLEPDNLLAFLALLGLVRALDESDRDRAAPDRLLTRAAFDVARSPLRPFVILSRPLTEAEFCARAAEGIERLSQDHAFGPWKDLNMPGAEARSMLIAAAAAGPAGRDRADLLAALITDCALKEEKGPAVDPVDPTPFCLLFGQGHQHFLERLGSVPQRPAPPPRGRGKAAVTLTGPETIAEALFEPWHRSDPTQSFRWDPEEDVRYGLMAGDPTDSAYKQGTQHGANRLAAVGLAVLTVVPEVRGGRPQTAVPGSPDGRRFRWPIWRDPARLATIRALLTHPGMNDPGRFEHLGVVEVLEARRISNGKFVNVTRGEPIAD